ncbi:hypothetical protein [Corynebacterium nuruki]|uniref:hypothetical protein n=1 Tax=Corynebacterium nuruki TaxID=1032851 RepID=UPI0002F0123D|nr:hypothetical protein [Corynebacterium nuruki]
MSQYWIPDTSVPTSTGRSANTPFRGASQRRGSVQSGAPGRPGRVSRFFRGLGRLWMERSRPEGPAVRLPDDPES